MRKILILGAGMVARPIVRYLLDKNNIVTVASNTPLNAEKMIDGHANGKSIEFSVDDVHVLENLVKEHDITVSLLPYIYHVKVAECCVKYKKNMVTTSYVKEEMKKLDGDAKKAGVIILNEAGLDPGIDHMSAMRIIDQVHSKGGKIEEFYSITGALVSPEHSKGNPFNYKFTWSPKGVVMAGNNDGKYLRQGKVVEIPTENLFKEPFMIDFPEVGTMEAYPNRDSLNYIDLYGIPEAQTMLRGTFRYPGWSKNMDTIKALGLISYDKLNLKGKTYSDMVALLINEKDSSDIRKKTADYLKIDKNSPELDAIEWLGLFDNTPINRDEASSYDITSDLMIEKMMIGENEKDMVVMQHTFLAKYPDGKKEVIRSRMLDFGSLKTDTSIARTVALPAAIAVEMILNNKIDVKGVHIPVIPQIYNPILDALEDLGIKCTEEFGLPLSENVL